MSSDIHWPTNNSGMRESATRFINANPSKIEKSLPSNTEDQLKLDLRYLPQIRHSRSQYPSGGHFPHVLESGHQSNNLHFSPHLLSNPSRPLSGLHMSNSGPHLPASNTSYMTSSPHHSLAGLEERSISTDKQSLSNCLVGLSSFEEQEKLRSLYPTSSPLLHYRQLRHPSMQSPTQTKPPPHQLANFFSPNNPQNGSPTIPTSLFSVSAGGGGGGGGPHFPSHPMRPSPPILPNANARTPSVSQPTVSFSSAMNALTAHQSKTMDRMRAFDANPFSSILTASNYNSVTIPHSSSALPSPTSLPMSAPNFAAYSESQALSHRLNQPRPPPTTSEPINLQQSSVELAVSQSVVIPPASTEQEVQKLLSLALTNSQQRLEKSCLPSGIHIDVQSIDDNKESAELTVSTSEYSSSQNQISSNEAPLSHDDLTSGHSSMNQERSKDEGPAAPPGGQESPSHHEQEPINVQHSFTDYYKEENVKKELSDHDNFPNKDMELGNAMLKEERLAECESADNWNQSLDVSQETRNAMESSGSPAIEADDTVECDEVPSYQASDDEGEDDLSQEINWINGENAVSNPTESERLSPDSDDGMTLAKFELYTSSIQPDKQGLFFCHLCEFTGKTRQEFHDHLRSHYDYKCDKCDYTSRTEGRLKRHLKDFHSEVPPQNFSGKTARGTKPKTLKCKQCDFLAQNKDDYWQHQRTHIKEEKRLECPRCPFVTEYKHHLEYHIRNHFGSKPYKCPKCNYMCVNKSMLNSHMKSHTNVYQYRCADCHYATKYCHSLKLHLSKNGHSPATVLNSDGSLPEYDNSSEILNMKRGPPRGQRHNPRQTDSANIRQQPEFNPMLLGSSDINPFFNSHHHPSPTAPSFQPGNTNSNSLWPFLPPAFPPGFPTHFVPGFNPSKFNPHNALPPTVSSSMDIKPLSMVLPHPNSLVITGNPTKSPLMSRPGGKAPSFTCTFCNSFQCDNISELSQHMMREHSFAETAAKFMIPGHNNPSLHQNKLPIIPQDFKSTQPAASSIDYHPESSSALDLSCSTTISTAECNLTKEKSNTASQHNEDQESCCYSSSNIQNSPENTDGNDFSNDGESNKEFQSENGDKPPRKRPRKSKAFHLDDLCARFEDQPANELCIQRASDPSKDDASPSSIVNHNNNNNNNNTNNFKITAVLEQQKKEYYECHYCDILFRGRTLFDIHMGYHCHADPFLCNRCGRQSRDNVEFFTHLGEVPHA